MRRIHPDAGIAFGPILFVVAIMAILAAALAAGSGSFTTSTGSDTYRTKAATLIEIGSTLKHGYDRLEGYVDFDDIVIDSNETEGTMDMFSPNGGGVNAPSITFANDPSSDIWWYPTGAIPGFGTSQTERLAMLEVDSNVCTAINVQANGLATTPGVADVGDPTSGALGAGVNNWPAELYGRPVGCVNNNNGSATGYWFFQVMGLR